MEKLTRKETDEFNLNLILYGMKYCNVTHTIQPIESFKNSFSYYAQRLYNKNKKEEISEYNKQYYILNQEDYKKRNKKRRKINSLKLKEKMQKDPVIKLRENIRSLISICFKKMNYSKNSRTHIILGCSFEEFKIYLENKFEPWMTWDNKGNPKDGIYELNKTWDIDHIIPITSAKNIEEMYKLNHYSNLQPLCSYHNRFIKKDNI